MVYSKKIRNHIILRTFALICAVILALAVTLAAATAFAEAIEPVPVDHVQFDWTPILVGVISLFGTVLSTMLGFAWNRYVKPWLRRRNLEEEASIVVEAVEALIGRYNGEQKWKLALEKMSDRGFYVESQAVIDALKAAWHNLNLSQILAGVKPPDTHTEE